MKRVSLVGLLGCMMAFCNTLAQGQEFGSSEFAITDAYNGPAQLPDFRGRDRKYNGYRTRLTEAAKKGPNFAGRYRILKIGCGTGCTNNFIIDVATGEVFTVPVGGEEQQQVILKYDIGSRLLFAFYKVYNGKDSDKFECIEKRFAWDEKAFTLQAQITMPDRSVCDFIVGND
jgi:hypothetical protein